MAIYSLNLGVLSRSEGRSSVGFSAYIAGASHKDVRTGKHYSYTRKTDVVVSRVLAPHGAPAWALNPSTLWNRVEQDEEKIVGIRFRETPGNPEKTIKTFAYRDKLFSSLCTAQTIMGAIPLELNQEQAERCVEDFLTSRFVSRGLVVHYAIHWDAGNPHFHGIITRRPLVNGEFSKRKDRDITLKVEHSKTRKAWEVFANKHLALAGFDVRIDCRSHKDRGSLFHVTAHEGYHAQHLAERGEFSKLVTHNETVRQKNIQIMVDNPEALVHEVSGKRTVFTRQHLEDEIIRRVGGDETLFQLLKRKVEGIEVNVPHENFAEDVKGVAAQLTERLLRDKTVVKQAGRNLTQEVVFTNAVHKAQHDSVLDYAERLQERQSKSVAPLAKDVSLSKEQQEAVHHLCSGPDLRLLNGRAGTGKTTLLKVVAESYQQAGYRVLGTSFQGKVVELMQREIGISCHTADSLLLQWQHHARQQVLIESGTLWGKPYLYAFNKMKRLEKSRLTAKDVLILDEANMLPGRLWKGLLSEASKVGAKVIVVQDTAQIAAREPGHYGQLLWGRFGGASTQTVVRQRQDWQKQCAAALNEGRLIEGLQPYHVQGHLHWHEDTHGTHEALVKAYVRDIQDNPQSTRMALASRNRDVAILNKLIQECLKTQGKLGACIPIAGQSFFIGDRVRLTKNATEGVKNLSQSWLETLKERLNPTQSQGVKNGTLGTLIGGNERKMILQLEDGRRVQINPNHYPHMTLGYAMTIHKSEGSTFDRTFVKLDPMLTPATLLVAMTRHREDVQGFVNAQEIPDFKALIQKTSRGPLQDTLQDYQVSELRKPQLENVRLYTTLVKNSIQLREEMESVLNDQTPFFKHPAFPAYKTLQSEKKETALSILKQWEAHLPFIRMAGLRRDVLEVAAGTRKRLLSEVEHRASLQAEGYQDLVDQTRSLWKKISQTHPPIMARHHPRYGEYESLKTERDALAYLFQETPQLYRPFLPYSLRQGVLSHSVAYAKRVAEENLQHRLNPLQWEAYSRVQTYIQSAKEAASLCHILKKDRCTLPREMTREMILHQLTQARTTRNSLAFQIVSEPHMHKAFLDNLHEEKLLHHACLGEFQETVYSYRNEKDPVQKGHLATELQKQIEKIPPAVMKQAEVSPQRLAFDRVYGKNKDLHGTHPEYLYNHIKDYTQSVQQATKAWVLKDNAGLKIAQKDRKEAALRLQKTPEALKIFQEIAPEKSTKLPLHAGQGKSVNPLRDAEDIMRQLQGRYGDLAQHLLGEPNKTLSNAQTLRFGRKGKLSVTLQGFDAGLWYDFSEMRGGNLLSLIQREKGLSFKEAVAFASDFAGLQEKHVTPRAHGSDVKTPMLSEDKIQTVQDLYKVSKPLKNTPADVYLREVRGCATSFCSDLRFFPQGTPFTYNGEVKTLSHPCLASFARNHRGELQAVQLTKLTESGQRALTQEEKAPKITYGVAKGSFVTVQTVAESPRTTFIAEGVETALSLKTAGLDGTVKASLGLYNMKNLEALPHTIILCSDNDGPVSRTADISHATAQLLREKGHSVTTVRPAHPGHDFNDTLRLKGPEHVKEEVERQIQQNQKGKDVGLSR